MGFGRENRPDFFLSIADKKIRDEGLKREVFPS